MQIVMTLVSVMAGMVFSLAIAILAEELIFGKLFRLLFVHPAVGIKSKPAYRHD